MEGINQWPLSLDWRIGRSLMLATAILITIVHAAAEDWPQFRGSDGNGANTQSQIPSEWSYDRHLAWKVRIPGSGWSQPVLFGDTIYLTTAISDIPSRPKDYASGTEDSHTVSGNTAPAPQMKVEWKVIAIDLKSGNLSWATTIFNGKPKYPIHPSNTYASETPAVDTQGIYVWFGTIGTAAALNHDGHVIWQRELGVFRHEQNLGSGSSPRLHQGLLYLQCFNEEQAFLVCLDAREGKEKWRITRNTLGTAWTTPLLWQNENRIELIVCGQKLITSHDPMNGRELWRGSGIEMAGPSSAVSDRNQLYFGFSSSSSKTKLYALKSGAEGDQSTVEETKTFRCEDWSVVGAAASMASPVTANGCVYVINQAVVGCYDATSGKQYYRERLPGFHCVVASPLVADQKIIILDESGSSVVLKTGSKFEIIGRSKLDDTFWASPAVSNDALVLRGVDFLYCIRE